MSLNSYQITDYANIYSFIKTNIEIVLYFRHVISVMQDLDHCQAMHIL